jgi:hypothetical protein
MRASAHIDSARAEATDALAIGRRELMAGRGPAPKNPAHRRNHHAPARGDWLNLEPLRKPVLPPLPTRTKAEGPWSARTQRLYAGWRQDPVTAIFGENETGLTIELAYLEEELVRGTNSLASEVRQRADGLGLTPKGKRDLRYRVLQPVIAPGAANVARLDDYRDRIG